MDTWKQDFIANNNPIFCLLEGVCPDCGEDVTIKSIGGIPSALENWTTPEGIEPTIWTEPYPLDTCGQAILGIEYVCPNNHVNYVEQNRNGDWN